MFSSLCLAFAFSPRAEALLAEAARFTILFNARLTVLHVGQLTGEQYQYIKDTLLRHGLEEDRSNIICDTGDPTKVILNTCSKNDIDLLIAGALQKENILKYYLGTIGRTILRKSKCSVLMLTNPSIEQKSIDNIVALAEDSPFIQETLTAACEIGSKFQSKWIHVVREIKLYGLTLSASSQDNEAQYDSMRQELIKHEIDQAEKFLKNIPHEGVKVNIKIVSGKSGFELARFTERKHADLLVVGAPGRRFYFIDRIFRHDLEYIFADMPCNLMVIHPARASTKKDIVHG
jgi:nucleotide-binding universal stress UspA family protein